MKRILVAVDGSEVSSRAVERCGDIAEKFGSKVTVVHVAVPLFVPPEPYGTHTAALEEATREYGKQLTGDATKALRDRGIDAEPLFLSGAPAELIVEASKSDDVDLVVVGSHGRGAVGRMLLGSVSDRVIRLSPKPVLVVH